MGLLDSYRINRAITTLLSTYDTQDPAVVQAVKLLQGYGPSAIPKLLAACANTRRAELFVTLLKQFVHDKTLPLFGKGLASENARVVAAVVVVLAHSKAYDPNLLLSLLADPQISKIALRKLLDMHQRSLVPRVFLQCIEQLAPQDLPRFLGLLRRIATATDVPLLLQRLESRDENLRLACAQTLVRFPNEDVRAAFYKLLSDPAPALRIAALDALEKYQPPSERQGICKLLWDERDEVRHEVKKWLARCHDPQLAHHLFDILEDPSAAAVHADAADLLGTIQGSRHIQQAVAARPQAGATRTILLRLLKAPQTKTRRVALVGLTALQSPCDIALICPLLWDADFQIRRLTVILLTQYQVPQTLETLTRALMDDAVEVRQGALAILNLIANPHILQELLRALAGADDRITERVIDLCGHNGSPQLMHAALQLMADTNAFLRHHIHKILRLTEDPGVVPFLVEGLANGEPWVRQNAMHVLGMLGEKGRQAVPALLERAQTAGEESVVALETLMKIDDPRAIPVCLACLQRGTLAQRKMALRALAVLTNAANFDVVLDSLLALRATADMELKDLCNYAAARLLKRFPDEMVRKHMRTSMFPPAPLVSVERPLSQSPSSLYIQGKGDETGLDTAAMTPGNILAGRYRIVQQIGKGGFGTVVLVHDRMVKEDIVLKFLHPHLATDAQMMQRFIQELRSARRITHENVIRIHDLLPVEQAYAISMEYFPSHDLGVEARAAKFLRDLPGGCQILISICRGMQAVHQAGIIHRDLKPSNILINAAGLVKVADFGLAATATDRSTRLTRPGTMLGTPLYMSPEQVRHKPLDARADIYSLGIMMYEMFTGTVPYAGGDPLAVLFQHVEGKAIPPHTVNPHLPSALEAVILKAMALEPAQRFQSMDELEKSLLPFLP